MSLPSGFDPETGTLGRVGTSIRRVIPGMNPETGTLGRMDSSVRRRSTYTYSRSGWDEFNDGVASIGEWIQGTAAEKIALVAAVLPAIAGIVYLLIWVVKVFINDGLFLGVLAIGGGVIAVGAGYYVICLIYGIAYIAILLFGFIFYNAYTLLITLVVGAGITVGVIAGHPAPAKTSTKTTSSPTTTAPAYKVYRCTADKLRVRTAPSLNSEVIGSLSRGSSVMVVGFEGEFARIKWNGGTAYVSKNYLAQ